MTSLQKQARVAGFLYLLVAIIAPFAVFYVPGKLIVRGDAAATAARVVESESLFRIGLVSNVVSGILFLLVVLALFHILKPVNEKHATAMVSLVLVGVTIGFIGALHELAALTAFLAPDFFSAFEKPERDALGYLFLRMSGLGGTLASIFWGLWLFPFGILIIRSGFIPRFLGFLVLLAGVGYVASSFSNLLLPDHASLISRFAMPLYFGEVPIILWLLIWGARERPEAPR